MGKVNGSVAKLFMTVGYLFVKTVNTVKWFQVCSHLLDLMVVRFL